MVVSAPAVSAGLASPSFVVIYSVDLLSVSSWCLSPGIVSDLKAAIEVFVGSTWLFRFMCSADASSRSRKKQVK